MAQQKIPTAPAPIAGRPVILDGYEYIVPPLSLFYVRQFAGQLKSLDLSGGFDPEKMDLITQVVHASLVRNYPELTPDGVLKLLDLCNVYTVFEAVMGISGFAATSGGEQPGESTGRS